MALASATATEAALDAIAALATHMALHTATPGVNGANETAETGSYARQTIAWNADASTALTNSSAETFSTLGAVAITHVGLWTSATYAAGTYLIGAALGSPVTAASITFAAGSVSFTCT